MTRHAQGKAAGPTSRADAVYDLLGVGFGPSNLALAAAIEESALPSSTRATFVERQPRFGWHRDMLIEGATMQVSFLKDLATLRNPRSPFSFLVYLQERGRLVDFINHKALFPSRLEFHDYLEWAAAKLSRFVSYGCEVVDVRPVEGAARVEALDVLVQPSDGSSPRTLRTRNLVLGLGLEPKLPEGVLAGPRIWHSGHTLGRLSAWREPLTRVAVVGAGQSAAEVVAHLHDRFPQTEVCSLFTRYGYSPADDSPFANRIFDPSAVDEFFFAPEPVKTRLLEYHRNTNYSVVDAELISELYRRTYQERVRGTARLRVLHATRVHQARDLGSHIALQTEFLPTGERSSLDCDLVVFATGYQPRDPLKLLGALAALCRRDAAGRLRIERDYRLCLDPGVECGVYLQGATEHSHGISSSLLSNTAVRAGEILQSVLRRGQPSSGVAPRLPYQSSQVELHPATGG